jgi:hypothetical protein
MSFNPINTQEEFDAAIRERLQRERDKYADYDSIKAENGTLKTQVTTLTGEKEALEKQVKGHATAAVKMRIAQELNIPASMADRLTGETEEDIRKDAESMANIFKTAQGAAPLYTNSQPAAKGSDAALSEMLSNLRGE